ncbi:type VII secretion protein EccCa [Enemella evansiae]|uniref:type VII secretion protein EccCa n=1 Tax=Enemella evansiae TaxID=2016499 RepID=UPI00105F2ED4|nr:type VII secretion protein EccCa [Enemella evansiae]TDO91509.1 S-DNA-T family DNA segregation ATPase FtsK/SpoIIIE [Enemella evansiae]
MATVTFNRPKRPSGPAMPRGDLLLESPPEIPPPSTGANWGMVLRMLPMLAGAGAMAMMMTSTAGARGPLGAVMGGMYGISMLGMMLSQTGRGNDDQAQQLDAARRDYFRYLGQMRKRIRGTAAEQRRSTLWIHPDPENLWTIAGTRRMWERRPEDGDFGSIRIGLGQQNFAQRITPPESKPVEDLEPLTVGALRRFMNTHRRVTSMPISLDLPSYRMVQLIGEEDGARRLAYAMVSQMAAWHAPTEFRILFCIAPENQRHWDWVKWLPHAQHPDRNDGAGAVRLFASSAAELTQLAEGAAGSLSDDTLRHIVVVADGVDGVNAGQFTAPGTTATTLEVSRVREAPRRIEPGTMAVEVREGQLHAHLRRGNRLQTSEIGPADQTAMVHAELLARALAPFRMPIGAVVEDTGDIADAPVFEAPKDYPSMVGVGDPAMLDTARVWKQRPLHQRLRVPIGNGTSGQPVELDIKEAAMSGMGPHGLCIGATGSGKSEFLRTLVLGLSMTHPPDQLNYVLVDFKGGATFAGLEELPHVSAVITNLEGELTLVDRMQDAIGGELDRRMEVLSQTNAQLKNRDIKNREEYDQARLDGADIPPMPSLFIVVDEFSELLTARPEFIDLFIQIGRIGRSIGVHLLLASQRLEESKLRGLDTFLSYRIALRTFSPQESRTVIGVPDAYELPSAPGNGYLKYDTTNMVQFKAAYVSGPWQGSVAPVRSRAGDSLIDAADEEEPSDTWIPPVLEFTPRAVEVPRPPEPELLPARAARMEETAPPPDLAAEPEPAPVATEDDEDDEETLLSVVVGRLRGQGWPAHKVWLPPLDVPPTLDELYASSFGDGGRLVEVEGRGLTTGDSRMYGRLQAPMGLIDRPRQQRRDPMWIDLAGGGGHLGVVGGPQTGKSTVLRSTVMSMALQHTPAEVGFYCLDFGGGALASLRGLPHVGSVCGRLDVDRVKRTVAELTSLLSARETQFGELGVESMQAYRRGRAQGSIPPDRFPSDVFLVVDGWITLRQEFEDLESTITQLAHRGLSFGIHVMLSGAKWSEFRMNIRDLLQSRIELKLGDNFESEINRKLAANVPEGRPGRGLSRDGLHSLAALPRIDGNPDVEELSDGVRAAVQQIDAAWRGPKAAEVRMLPDDLTPAQLPGISRDETERAFPIGVDELELAPVWFDPASEPHLVAFGAPECGKSTLIRTILEGITTRYSSEDAKILLLDYRRQHLGLVPDDYLISYCASSQAATDMSKHLAEAVRVRLPGPDVSQEELRNRSWWQGMEIFVVVDDYDLVATSMNNPLQPFADLVSQASDIGLHIIIARGMGGAGRAAFSDALIARMKDGQSPGLIMSGTKDEGQLLADVRPFPLPPGRGTFVTRGGKVLIQTVNTPAPVFD